MNISITNLCNRRCEYCFQRTWYLSSKTKFTSDVKEMDIEYFKKLVNKFVPQRTVRIMGGEPLLYSKLDDLFKFIRDKDKRLFIISNLSADQSKIDSLINNIDLIKNILINCDYPKSQQMIFMTNFTRLINSGVRRIGLSTTLLPDYNSIIKSAKRLEELLGIIVDNNVKFRDFVIRVAPYCPAPGCNYKEFNYTQGLLDFFNIIWSRGKVNTTFDCVLLKSELDSNLLKALRDNGVSIDTRRCNEDRDFPLDVMVDGSAIWCSSCNYVKLDNIDKFNTEDEMRDALIDKWNEFVNKKNLNKSEIQCLAKYIKW